MANILVVDDVPEQLKTLEQAAMGEGRSVVSTTDMDQAIRLISEKNFDIVVTDLELKAGDLTGGFDVLNAAKEKDPNTQVIVVTAYRNPELPVRAMGLGAFDYIDKNALGINVPAMVHVKIDRALEFREAVLQAKDPTTVRS